MLAYPADWNPYQSLLYAPMERSGRARVVRVPRRPYIGLWILPFTVIRYRLQGFRIFHVHWPAWYVYAPNRFRLQISTVLCASFLAAIRSLGFKIVWTVHNVVPHEPQTLDDLAVSRHLASTADAIVVHSKATIESMTERDIDTSAARIIPHGNYIDSYAALPSPAEARASLALPAGFTILFFGLIRAYKGVDELISARADPRLADTNLLIAGECEDGELRERITEASRNERLLFHGWYVADSAVPSYFAAADVVCLPFREVTTSGSALLAMSFGSALVAPRIGTLLDLPDDTGFFYDPEDPDGLPDALARARESAVELAARRAAALAYAKRLDWRVISDMTLAVYADVLGA